MKSGFSKLARVFSNAAWVPLRASVDDKNGDLKEIGHVSEYFGCGSVAFPPEHEKRGLIYFSENKSVPFSVKDWKSVDLN